MEYPFISDVDSGIECSLRKFADDIKLSGTVDMQEGWNAIQRNSDKLEQWALVYLTKFSVGKCKVLHLTWAILTIRVIQGGG